MLLQLYQRQYLGWCQHHDRDALDGGAEQVAEFLRSLLETIGSESMRFANIGVSFYLVAMGRPATEHHPLALAVLKECRERSAERKPVQFRGAPMRTSSGGGLPDTVEDLAQRARYPVREGHGSGCAGVAARVRTAGQGGGPGLGVIAIL